MKNKLYNSKSINIFNIMSLDLFYSFYQFKIGIEIIFDTSARGISFKFGFFSIGIRF